ncbi:MAG: S-layer homology domain-containing protein [Oscillospiraceae bacterium]|nr:S-layer homology domain-containing protein [Oscillospiraceae bacterium]
MKKKILALVLALVLIPAVIVCAAQTGYADSMMEDIYAIIGGGQALTIRSHVSTVGRGGYSHALYAVELTGVETKEDLDTMAAELLERGAEPVWGGSKHCYHGSAIDTTVTYTLNAADRAPGSYLYVCYSFGCDGGDYSHHLIPNYERISTMAVQVTREAEGLNLRYALLGGDGAVSETFADGDEVVLDLNGGVQTLMLLSETPYPVERILAVTAAFPDDQTAAFAFDETTLALSPVYCGSGSITVTVGNYLDDTTRTETVHFTVPCAPQPEQTVLIPNSCTEDGLTAHLCHGHDINCETVFDEEVLPAHGHRLFSVSQIVQAPTATLPGVGMGTCSVCGIIGIEAEIPPIFSDVVSDAFYSVPLDYCYAEGWVTGVTADTFAPNNACVRAQVVTFLWRAAGEPEPTLRENPFADVSEGDFYYKAVLWAVENGITNGTDAAHFSPMGPCNRAQVVTFLWRALGQPEFEAAEHPFTDVPAGSFYEQPVLWAVENGITAGMTATSFGPAANCNRAQIVTFLYRAYAE